MGASVAAIVILRKQEDLVEHFRHAGATSSATAKSVDELGVDTRMVWHGMLRRAVVREASPGRFYLDEPSWEAMRGRRRRRVVIVLGVVVLALVAFVLLRTSPGAGL